MSPAPPMSGHVWQMSRTPSPRSSEAARPRRHQSSCSLPWLSCTRRRRRLSAAPLPGRCCSPAALREPQRTAESQHRGDAGADADADRARDVKTIANVRVEPLRPSPHHFRRRIGRVLARHRAADLSFDRRHRSVAATKNALGCANAVASPSVRPTIAAVTAEEGNLMLARCAMVVPVIFGALMVSGAPAAVGRLRPDLGHSHCHQQRGWHVPVHRRDCRRRQSHKN
jgi:hypothetical protein